MKIHLVLLSFFVALYSNHAFSAEPSSVVVLVPGFFNSLAAGYFEKNPQDQTVSMSPYFSRTIVRALESSGHKVVVVNTLSPLGSLEKNGELVLRFLQDLRKSDPGAELHIVGHSAGSLYAIYALDRDSGLAVKSLTAISTPFEGVDLVDNIPGSTAILKGVSHLIDLRSLIELKRARVTAFLATKHLPDSLRLHLYAAHQSYGGAFGWTKAEYLSWPMAITAAIGAPESDGIVGTRSAMGGDVHMLTRSQHTIRLSDYDDEDILPLEHWEQVLDARYFEIIGVLNPSYIERQQTEFFTKIGRSL